MVLEYIAYILYSPYLMYLQYNNKTPQEIYKLLEGRILGRQAFNGIISIVSPYSSSIHPNVECFEKKECKCSIEDRRYLRNPFNSIHALALSNLGELTSGLIMMEHVKKTEQRGIMTEITSKYYKKARGKITAISSLNTLKNGIIISKLFDEDNDLVCKISSKWLLKDIQPGIQPGIRKYK